MPVHVEESQRLGAGGGVAAGQRHDQVRGLAGRGELAELAADGLDFRRPVQAQHPAQRRGRDPGGAFGPGLAGQGQEHQGQQRGSQPVVAVAEPAVDLAGGLQQPGALQGGQRQQQPGQRVPGTGGEDRLGALAEQPPPGQRPLPVPGHRIGQHRQRLIRRLAVPLLRHAALIGVTVPGPSLAARQDPAQRGPDGERRHPGRRRDLPQRLAGGVQPGDPGRQPGRQLRRAFGPAPGRDQPGHPGRGQRLVPPPDGGRVHPERLRHLPLRRRPQPDQLHRRQPAARLVPAIPGEGGQPVHRDQPAVFASQQAHAGGDLGRPGRQQRERKLAEHASHHPPSRQVVYLARIFSQTGHAETERHAVNADQPASITRAVGPMSGVLVLSATGMTMSASSSASRSARRLSLTTSAGP